MSSHSRTFRHTRSRLVTGAGLANHRGRDAIFIDGQDQTIEAKFAYGTIDKDLKDEDVLLEVEIEGEKSWTEIGIATTSRDDGPSEDDGGRARFTIPVERRLPRGRHRVRATVLGDGTWAELHLVVVPKNHGVFISDVDGTLTSSEVAEFPALAVGKLPDAHPSAAEVFRRLAKTGLVPIYLTARPEWLMARTRLFLQANNFPPGIVCTRKDKSGGYGASAAAFKRAELERIAKSDLRIEWAFGNMPSDALAYVSIVQNARQRVLLKYEDKEHGARRIDSYADLLEEIL
jgi:phosphatidate phosphatase PAH1